MPTTTTQPDDDRYNRYSYVLRSELAPKTRYCSECETLEVEFRYSSMKYDGCDGVTVAKYECVGCGENRYFGVVIE